MLSDAGQAWHEENWRCGEADNADRKRCVVIAALSAQGVEVEP